MSDALSWPAVCREAEVEIKIMTKFKAATPAFPVKKLDTSTEFYGKKLGFSVVAQGEDFALLERDGLEFVLWLTWDESWQDRVQTKPIDSGAESFLAGTASCRIEVSDIATLFDEYKNAGVVHPNGQLRRASHPAEEFDIFDPDGNILTFWESIGPNTT